MSIDQFGAIAANFGAHREALITPEPEVLPSRYLPNEKTDSSAVFEQLPRMKTQQELELALDDMRDRFVPFLAEVAPEVKVRPSVELKTGFLWRVEDGTDRADGFAEALNGDGRWEGVELPHYAGPMGRAVASYRTEFTYETASADESVWLCFEGVDYRSEVYVNGLFAGNHEGFFEHFEFEIGKLLKNGTNTLVIRVFNEAPPTGFHSGNYDPEGSYDGDKLYACTGPGWDDPQLGWHHCPPGMGILAPIRIEKRPKLFISDIFVRPLDDLKSAEVWVEVFNCNPTKVSVELTMDLYGLNYKAHLAHVEEKPKYPCFGKRNRYRFTVQLPESRIWSPDTPWMNEIHVTLKNTDDCLARRFGMRVFTMDTASTPKGRLFLNHQSIRLFGANTMGFEQQDVMRGDVAQLVDDILLARIANLNFWRITQRPVQKEVYDYCDRLGFMVQCDFPTFGKIPRTQFAEAIRQCSGMERLVRNHPSVIITTFINEPYPADMVEETRQLVRYELERFFEAAADQIHLENPDRVIKPVDGDYDPPAEGICDIHCYNLWYNGHMIDYGRFHRGYWTEVKPGWYLGCGEYGIEGLDFEDLMRRRYPAEWLPAAGEDESTWNPGRILRAQTGLYSGMFYERCKTLADWVETSQNYQSWGVADMTRKFRRDNRFVTFAVHLFIDAWPAGWMKTVMDCERRAKPAFFSLRDALEPLRCDIRSDRTRFFAGESMKFEFRVINSTHTLPQNASIRWQIRKGKDVLFAGRTAADIKEDESVFQGFFDYPSPRVEARCNGTVELGLEVDGRLVNTDSLDLEYFPAGEDLSAIKVIPVGPKSRQTALQLGVTIVNNGGVYLVDDYAEYDARRGEIESAVANGARVVFHDLPFGKYVIGGKEIDVVEATMSPRFFVSRDTGHPLVDGFTGTDFRFWYSPKEDCLVSLVAGCFKSNDFQPVLTTVLSGESKEQWDPAQVAGTMGNYVVMTLRLVDVCAANPVARKYVKRILEWR